MKKFYLTICVTIILTCFLIPVHAQLQNSPWPMYQHDAQHTGRSSYVGPDSPDLVWSFDHGTQYIRFGDSPPVIDMDGVIYVGSGDKYLTTIDSDGSLKFTFRVTDDNFWYSAPAIGKDAMLYIGTNDFDPERNPSLFYAIDPEGELEWSLKVGDVEKSSPAIDSSGTIYVGTLDNGLNAITSKGELKWQFDTEGAITASPAIDQSGTIYVGDEEGYFYAVSPGGSEKWQLQVPGKIYGSAAIDSDGTIYFGNADWEPESNFLYALNPDGTEKWKFPVSSQIRVTPAIGSDGTIYFGSYDYHFYAVNTYGTLEWKYKIDYAIACSPVVDDNGNTYWGSNGDAVYALNSSGGLKWIYPLTISSPPAIGSNGVLYISTDYSVLAIGKEQQPAKIDFSLTLDPPLSQFASGDSFDILLGVKVPPKDETIDLYFVMLNPSNKIYFGFLWDMNPAAVLSNFTLPANFTLTDATLLNITIPNDTPPISDPGTYTFAIGATDPGTFDFISNIPTVSFDVQ